MQAIRIVKHGGPDVLEVVDVPGPKPAPGQVLVDAAAVGVNYRDVYEREGVYGGELPRIIGAEAAGTVAAIGEGVSEFAAGDRVAWISAPGSYAMQVAVDAERVVPVPAGVSDELAATLMQGITAQYLTTSTHAVQPGENVLVHAAAGGLGFLLTQMVTMLGGVVIATTSTEEKAKVAREAGAAEVIPYERFAARVRELTGGLGVDVVYDGVGAATFDESLESLRPRGLMVLSGTASGRVPAVDPMRLENGGSLYLTRPSIRHYTATRQELLDRARDVFEWITEGRLRVRIGGRYPLKEARSAHEALEGRRTTGKLLLIPRAQE
ncbi:MAG TPA: quinone oxidoreductase [Gaiellaceae bacterium]|nr:quinone oxidoreductase [Gaiellaceae bacterium]